MHNFFNLKKYLKNSASLAAVVLLGVTLGANSAWAPSDEEYTEKNWSLAVKKAYTALETAVTEKPEISVGADEVVKLKNRMGWSDTHWIDDVLQLSPDTLRTLQHCRIFSPLGFLGLDDEGVQTQTDQVFLLGIMPWITGHGTDAIKQTRLAAVLQGKELQVTKDVEKSGKSFMGAHPTFFNISSDKGEVGLYFIWQRIRINDPSLQKEVDTFKRAVQEDKEQFLKMKTVADEKKQ